MYSCILLKSTLLADLYSSIATNPASQGHTCTLVYEGTLWLEVLHRVGAGDMAGETLRGCPTFEAGMSLLNGQLGDPNPYEVQAQITVTWNEKHGVSRSPICAN